MKLHNNYPLAPDEIEIEREMLPNYQIKIADFYNIVKNGVRKNFLVFKVLRVVILRPSHFY